MTSNMVLIRIRYAPSPKGLRHGQRGGPARPGPSGLPTRRQGRALEPSCGHDLPTGESPPARAAENGRNRSARVRDPCRAPYGSRCHGFVDPFARGSDCAFPLRAPSARSTGYRLRPPTVGFGRGTELAQPFAPFEFSFGPSGYAGLIIPASWNPSTPCRAHTVAPLMTEPILAGNAIA